MLCIVQRKAKDKKLRHHNNVFICEATVVSHLFRAGFRQRRVNKMDKSFIALFPPTFQNVYSVPYTHWVYMCVSLLNMVECTQIFYMHWSKATPKCSHDLGCSSCYHVVTISIFTSRFEAFFFLFSLLTSKIKERKEERNLSVVNMLFDVILYSRYSRDCTVYCDGQ